MYVAFAKIQKSKFGVPRDILLTSEVRGREVTNQNNGKDALYLHPFVAAADDKGKVIMCHGEGGECFPPQGCIISRCPRDGGRERGAKWPFPSLLSSLSLSLSAECIVLMLRNSVV